MWLVLLHCLGGGKKNCRWNAMTYGCASAMAVNRNIMSLFKAQIKWTVCLHSNLQFLLQRVIFIKSRTQNESLVWNPLNLYQHQRPERIKVQTLNFFFPVWRTFNNRGSVEHENYMRSHYNGKCTSLILLRHHFVHVISQHALVPSLQDFKIPSW